MLTILSTPKAFTGLFAVIQRNAIESWTRSIRGLRSSSSAATPAPPSSARSSASSTSPTSRPTPGHAAAERHVPHWPGAGEQPGRVLGQRRHHLHRRRDAGGASVVAEHPRPAYLVGRRTDLDQLEPLDFSGGWDDLARARPRREGELKPANWIDYFMFTAWTVHRAAAVRDRPTRVRPVADLAGRRPRRRRGRRN